MIEFKLLKECEDCPEFEVCQDTQCVTLMDGKKVSQHLITCEHIGKCQQLLKHLKEVNNYGNQKER